MQSNFVDTISCETDGVKRKTRDSENPGILVETRRMSVRLAVLVDPRGVC
jgi:hypothetical protein